MIVMVMFTKGDGNAANANKLIDYGFGSDHGIDVRWLPKKESCLCVLGFYIL